MSRSRAERNRPLPLFLVQTAGVILSFLCLWVFYKTGGQEPKVIVGGAVAMALAGGTVDRALEEWHRFNDRRRDEP